MSGSVRKRQKKLEKARKKRQLSKKEARKIEARYEGANLLRLASSAPFGPCWVGTSLDERASDGLPQLVTVVVTRRVRGRLLGEVVLVDRTCLGLKNANLLPRWPELELRDYVHDVLEQLGELRECSPLEAQSVVLHALAYARSLGFSPHPDFEPALFEPWPESLQETPLAHPARPSYISGPHDDVELIVERLERAVGSGNYDLMAGAALESWFEEEEDYADEDEDAIETTGESHELE